MPTEHTPSTHTNYLAAATELIQILITLKPSNLLLLVGETAIACFWYINEIPVLKSHFEIFISILLFSLGYSVITVVRFLPLIWEFFMVLAQAEVTCLRWVATQISELNRKLPRYSIADVEKMKSETHVTSTSMRASIKSDQLEPLPLKAIPMEITKNILPAQPSPEMNQ